MDLPRMGASPHKPAVRIPPKAGDMGDLLAMSPFSRDNSPEQHPAPPQQHSGGGEGTSCSSWSVLPPLVGGQLGRAAPDDGDGAEEGDEDLGGDLSPRSRTYTEGLNSGRYMPLTRVVSVCAAALRYGVHSIQGLRPEMEDAHRVVLDVHRYVPGADGGAPSGDSSGGDGRTSPTLSFGLAGAAEALGNVSYFGVFDGHGGSQAAEFVSERLCTLLAQDFGALAADPQEALRRAFVRTEEQWLEAAAKDELFDGTTAAVALLDRQRGLCVVGNVGDSEVIIGTRRADGVATLEVLTEVHRIKGNDAEAARVEALGGRVWKGRLGHPRLNPKVASLAVSRAIGDLFFKDNVFTQGKASGLIADPHVTSVQVRSEGVTEQFLLLGCDGFWDKVSYQEALNYVFRLLDSGEDTQAISESLVTEAHDAGSSDNITVMVVML